MKFFSIDIETTGLDPEKCQVLEIACIMCDTTEPITSMVNWRRIVKHGWIVGQPVALDMNRDLIASIAKGNGDTFKDVMFDLSNWIATFLPSTQGKQAKFIAAGKNFGSFDNLFLKWNHSVRPYHRTLDPGPIFAHHCDEFPPDLEECCRRASVVWDPLAHHTALYDARCVAHCLYNYYNRGSSVDIDR